MVRVPTRYKESGRCLRGKPGRGISDVGVVVGGVKFILPRWAHLGRQARAKRNPYYLDQRCAPRVPVALPVLIYGRMGDEPFQEQAETINVSMRGGLVPIAAEVVHAQKLILTNLQTNEELACRVARLVRTEEGSLLAGLEFLQASPRFWGTAVLSQAASGPGPVTTGRNRRWF